MEKNIPKSASVSISETVIKVPDEVPAAAKILPKVRDKIIKKCSKLPRLVTNEKATPRSFKPSTEFLEGEQYGEAKKNSNTSLPF